MTVRLSKNALGGLVVLTAMSFSHLSFARSTTLQPRLNPTSRIISPFLNPDDFEPLPATAPNKPVETPAPAGIRAPPPPVAASAPRKTENEIPPPAATGRRTRAAAERTEADAICPDGRCPHSGAHLPPTQIHEDSRRILNMAQAAPAAATTSGNSSADIAMRAAETESGKCRTMARFRGGGNSCRIFGNRNKWNSKGLCSTAVQAALREAGILLPRGDAATQVRNLDRSSLIKISPRINKYQAPGGSVIACGGGHRGGGNSFMGHIQIVVVSKTTGKRMFCSDFCTEAPICGRRPYGQANIYKFPGT